jgi:hypothetical protein
VRQRKAAGRKRQGIKEKNGEVGLRQGWGFGSLDVFAGRFDFFCILPLLFAMLFLIQIPSRSPLRKRESARERERKRREKENTRQRLRKKRKQNQ